jgi:hypothetical protein
MNILKKYFRNIDAARVGLLALLVVSMALTGCGTSVDGRPTPVAASGVVFYKKEPCANAKVLFAPEDHQYTAVGQTDSSGRFRLQTFDPGDGAVPGNFKVVVSKFEAVDLPNGGFRETFFLPQKYRNPQTSGLKAVVPENGTQDITIDLTE